MTRLAYSVVEKDASSSAMLCTPQDRPEANNQEDQGNLTILLHSKVDGGGVSQSQALRSNTKPMALEPIWTTLNCRPIDQKSLKIDFCSITPQTNAILFVL